MELAGDSTTMTNSNEGEGEGDRISNLPEGILHHILSFLDMKHVVQTSVLSTKWRYVWTFLPFLNFRDCGSRFEVFVGRVLLLRESCSNIHSFSLICSWHYYDVYNYSWILKALRQNVQELYLDLYDDFETFPLRFPSCLFTCKSLTIFELRSRTNSLTHNLHDSMSLPNLKTLLLEGVWLDASKVNKICKSCPVLESLTLFDCEFDLIHQTEINISTPNLKYLVIESLWKDCSIKIYAPNLMSFHLSDFLTSADYSINDLPALVRAHINMGFHGCEELDEKLATWMFNFLRVLHSVQHLTLSNKILEVVSGAHAVLLDRNLIEFGNLRCLELRTWLSSDYVNAITYLLKISPNIESLFFDAYKDAMPYLDEVKTNSPETEAFYEEAGLLTQYTLHHLKSVEIQGIQGCLKEFMFLEFLLKNSPVLENMVLYAAPKEQSTHTKSRRLVEFTKQLRSLPRVSSFLTILLL